MPPKYAMLSTVLSKIAAFCNCFIAVSITFTFGRIRAVKLVRTPADVLYGPLAVKITSMTSSVETSPFEGGRTDV